MTASTALLTLTRRYQRRRLAAAAFLGGAAGIGATILGVRYPAISSFHAAIALGTLAIVAVAFTFALRGRPDARSIAQHLDRSDPALGESAELLLADAAELSVTERLARVAAERAFVERAWSIGRLPDRRASVMIAGGIVLLAVALLVAFLPPDAATSPSERTRSLATAAMSKVTRVSIDVSPPAYLGAPRRTQHTLELEVPEGAGVTWSVWMSGPRDAAALVTTRGDTVALARGEGGALRGSLRARESSLYRVVFRGGGSEFHRITVHPDAAPAVTILRPAPRTVIQEGASRIVPLDVLVRDDHGVRAADVVATVTSGTGESVRFRERRLALGSPRSTPDGTRFSASLDLDALGMVPGDELYFHAVATDTRRPANEGRSETVFLALADTAQAKMAEFTGLALGAGPEYFRSQRQIIMDTEELIADAPRLPLDIARERANAIGMDQGLLRLRYGEFTGEEYETSAGRDAAHEHDDPENATLLDPGTKATLKGAIAEMWQAELRLRTYRVREALPYEYRALDLLKSVQQSGRIYAQRAGFEPPPLEPDRNRLSGKLDAVRSRALDRSLGAVQPHEAARATLQRLRELERGSAAAGADRALVDAAIAELGASGDPEPDARLTALRELQPLADSLRSGRGCPACASRAAQALALALPPAPAAPGLAPPRGTLERRYFQRLRGR